MMRLPQESHLSSRAFTGNLIVRAFGEHRPVDHHVGGWGTFAI